MKKYLKIIKGLLLQYFDSVEFQLSYAWKQGDNPA